MEIKETRHDDIVLLELLGGIDTRTVHEFEEKVLHLLGEGARRVVVDFEKVDQLTSSGLRVLLMLGKKLEGIEGGLVLCSLSDHVRTILEVSGLTGLFTIEASKEAALAQLPRGATGTKISALALKLLEGGENEKMSRKPARKANRQPGSKLSTEVAELLAAPRRSKPPRDPET